MASCLEPFTWQAIGSLGSAAAGTVSVAIAAFVFRYHRIQKARDEVLLLLKELPAGLPHASELKKSFWDWYPRSKNANVTFPEVYAPWVRLIGTPQMRTMTDALEQLIVRELFDLWEAQKSSGAPFHDEPTSEAEQHLWLIYEQRRKQLREAVVSQLSSSRRR
jgi:hypothetical protein